MPKVTEEYRTARREEILAAAMRAFQRRGFQATSMADIITESGLSAGAIYGHFASKSDIVIGVARKVIGARAGEIEQLQTQHPLPPPASLVRLLLAGMMRDLGQPSLIVQIWGEAVVSPEISELTTTVFGDLKAILHSYIARWHVATHGVSQAEAEATATEQLPLFLSAAQGFMFQSALVPGFDPEGYLTMIEKYLPR